MKTFLNLHFTASIQGCVNPVYLHAQIVFSLQNPSTFYPAQFTGASKRNCLGNSTLALQCLADFPTPFLAPARTAHQLHNSLPKTAALHRRRVEHYTVHTSSLRVTLASINQKAAGKTLLGSRLRVTRALRAGCPSLCAPSPPCAGNALD